ncbi:MAG: hypothetical protein WCQ50_09250 [Spirochaetota bacterium]
MPESHALPLVQKGIPGSRTSRLAGKPRAILALLAMTCMAVQAVTEVPLGSATSDTPGVLSGVSPGLSPGESPRALIGTTKQLEVSVEAGPRKGWIHARAVFQTAYPYSGTRVYALLNDYSNISRLFSRIWKERIVATIPGGYLMEQETGVKILGFVFSSTIRLRTLITPDVGGGGTIQCILVNEGGALENNTTTWQIRELSSSSGPLCLATYSIEFDTLNQFPGQILIMRQFGPQEIAGTLVELREALDRLPR